MEVCRELNLNPWCTLLLKEFVQTDKDQVKGLLGDLADKVTPTVLFKRNGEPLKQILITFQDKAIYEEYYQNIDHGALIINKNSYPCLPVSMTSESELFNSSVWSEPNRTTKPVKATHPQFIRTLKPYSGSEKQPESILNKWIEEAYDAIDDDSLGEDVKLRIVKNGLSGTALSIVNSSKLTTAVSAIELVRETFGSTHSVEQYWINFSHMFQLKGESAEKFWIRLHEALRDIARSDPNTLPDQDERRIKQFVFGLSREDSDSLELHLHLKDMNSVGKAPTFQDMLGKLRNHGRSTRERDERAGMPISVSHIQQSVPDKGKSDNNTDSRLTSIEQSLKDLKASMSCPILSNVQTQKPKHKKGGAKNKNKHPETVQAVKIPKECFKCGEEGHTVWDGCPNEHDPVKSLRAMENQLRLRKKPKQKSILDGVKCPATEGSGN